MSVFIASLVKHVLLFRQISAYEKSNELDSFPRVVARFKHLEMAPDQSQLVCYKAS